MDPRRMSKGKTGGVKNTPPVSDRSSLAKARRVLLAGLKKPRQQKS
jgi:hypothetical protein